MGNLYSVSKALERMEYEYIISNDPAILRQTNGLILPGVGAFKDAMTILEESKLAGFIKESVKSGKPLLGICLGMQLLFEESEENGQTKGLGLLEGKIVKIPGITPNGEKYKVPHMGWNALNLQTHSPLINNVNAGHVYFVHSYYAVTEETNSILASCTYDVEIPAIVGKGNVFGTQFHPEKSGEIGLTILKNFLTLVKEGVTV